MRLQNGEQQYALHPENSHEMFNSVFAAPVLLQAVIIEGRVKGREYWTLDGLPVVGRGGNAVVVAVPCVVESETPPPCELPAAVVLVLVKVVVVVEAASAVEVWATGPCWAMAVCFFFFPPTPPPTAAAMITTRATTAIIMIPFLVR